MRHDLDHFFTKPFPKLHHLLLVTGGAEACPRENGGVDVYKKSQQKLITIIFTSDPGKAILQNAAIQVPLNHLSYIGAENTVFLDKMIFVNLFQGFCPAVSYAGSKVASDFSFD